MEPLLSIRDLRVMFGPVHAVNGVDLDVAEGGCLGVVGESGCGKSATFLAVMGLIRGAGRIVGGSIRFQGRQLIGLDPAAYRALRGREIAITLQDALTSLNPALTVGTQIEEVLHAHTDLPARASAIDMLRRVGIPAPERRLADYPHQFSGGMRQRIMIAIALCCRPKLLIADEPTTALDVTVQAQVLELIGTMRQELGMSVVLVTHDLGVVAEQADEVAIMYAGRIVEYAPTLEIFDRPLHPYTQALFRSMPTVGGRHERLEAIPGQVPELLHLPSGCAFRDRCPRAIPACAAAVPPLEEKASAHTAACIRV
jgi:oligopeptide/dipeptide ABC transporter ATP-binding protein